MAPWNGEDRRKEGDRRDQDHDLLVEVHTMLKGFQKTYEKHVEDDEGHFSRLYSGQSTLRWYIGIGIGVFSAIEVLFNHIFKN